MNKDFLKSDKRHAVQAKESKNHRLCNKKRKDATENRLQIYIKSNLSKYIWKQIRKGAIVLLFKVSLQPGFRFTK